MADESGCCTSSIKEKLKQVVVVVMLLSAAFFFYYFTVVHYLLAIIQGLNNCFGIAVGLIVSFSFLLPMFSMTSDQYDGLVVQY